MNELLANIISVYSFNHRILDEKIITIIIEKLIKEYKLEDYIKDVKVIDFDDISNNINNGSYSYLKKQLLINIPILYDTIEKLTEFDNDKITEEEKYFEINIRILEVLFHEIKHARQFKKYIETPNDDIEKELLSYFIENVIKVEKSNNQKNHLYVDVVSLNQISNYYIYSPTERMADLSSSLAIMQLFDNSNFKEFKTTKLYYYILHTFRELRGYDIINNKILSPSAKFKYEYELVRKKHKERLTFPNQTLEEFYQKYNAKGLGLNQRVYYGLPITMEEQESILVKRRKLQNLYK